MCCVFFVPTARRNGGEMRKWLNAQFQKAGGSFKLINFKKLADKSVHSKFKSLNEENLNLYSDFR